LETVFRLLVVYFPLSRAEHRRGGRDKARGLSEPAVAQAKAGEFPRAPAAPTTRRMKRDTGVFFCFVFFHGKENEENQNRKKCFVFVEPIRLPLEMGI